MLQSIYMKHQLVLHKLLVIGVISTAISVGSFSSIIMAQTIATVDIQTGLVGHWQFDENTENMMRDITFDSTGNSLGVLTNGSFGTQGKIGGGLHFDGFDDGVNVTSQNDSPNNLKSFTFTAWIFPTKSGGIIFRKGSGPEAYFNIFTLPETGQGDTGQFGMRAGYTQSTGAWRTKTAVSLNSWHHVAIVYTHDVSQTPSLYVDGIRQEIYQKYTPIGDSLQDDSKIFIGNNHIFSSGFGGTLDDVRLYNRILSPDQIRTIWNFGLGGVANQSRPNIVVIMTDDQDDMDSMAVMPKTRNLIGSQGLTFTNSFVDFPLCCSSRVSFLTGQAAHNTGVLANAPPDGGYLKFQPTEGNALPVWLQQAGYVTAHMGKYPNGYGAGDTPFNLSTHIPPGWTLWNGMPDSVGGYSYYNYSINENGVLHPYGNTPADYKTDVQAQKAADFIANQQNSPQPFFLWLAPLAPHQNSLESDAKGGATANKLPIPAPRHLGLFDSTPLPQSPNFNEVDVSDKPRFVQLFPLMDASSIASTTESFRRHRESLLAVDDMVERVVNALQSAGELDNTIIVFTSDNGFFEGQHRIPGGKLLVYEESIRVPLLIRGPGIQKGQTRSQLVNNLDLVATIEELAGAAPGRIPDGNSLTPLFQNPSAPWRSSLLAQGMDKIFGNGYLYGRFQAIRTNNYIYVEHNGTDFGLEKELYDLMTDPYELNSKHNDPAYTPIMNDLRGRLNILRTCAGESCWMTSIGPTPPTGVFNPNPPQPPPPTTPPVTPSTPGRLPSGPFMESSPGAGYSFGTSLRVGMKNQDVTRLQAFLGQNPLLYPEGLVTGYFGTLTRQAVIRFQEKYASEILQPLGLSGGTGFVGSATLKKLNELVK